MATLIDKSYFDSGLSRINQISNPITGAAIQDELQHFINIHEVRFVDRLIGKTLRKALYSGLAETTPDARWTELRDKLIDSSAKLSPIAYYVSHHWHDSHQMIDTVTGSMLPDNNNVNFAKVEDRWDAMRDAVLDFIEWWNDGGYADYPEFDAGETMWIVLLQSVNILDI